MKRAREAVSGHVQLVITPEELQDKRVVRSLIGRAGECEFQLSVYPQGNGNAAGTHLSAYVSVQPSPNWEPNWSFPDVTYTISLNSASTIYYEPRTSVRTFEARHRSWGVGKILPLTDLAEFLSPAGALRLDATICGDSLSVSPRVVPNIGKQMWKSRKFTDMVIAAGGAGSDIGCHRSVLAAASDVFSAMLHSEMSEGCSCRVVMPDASEDSVRLMLQHIYTGTLGSDNIDVLLEVMSLGEKYDLGELQAECARQLTPLISRANVPRACEVFARCRREPEVQKHLQILMSRLQSETGLLEALVIGVRAAPVGPPAGPAASLPVELDGAGSKGK